MSDHVTGPATCPDCGTYTDFRFALPLEDIPAFFVGRKWYSLQEFPVELFCPRCPWMEDGIGSQFTIDIDRGVVTFGRVRRTEQ